ncbi:hypothetical protein [Pseudomonas plecoglossicida]|uniref:hypothetical protein n=1 Tax=Pseudomonas plecoglossicida TaxID=70775 RepID=UPI00051D444C|nr:hypothetical protein [Pseudomonas plecoglossicida]KGK24279.1 hypothetical protein GT93_05230 [Pseudomonas plecoglossicida]
MAGFADLFSAENVGNLMQDPRMQLGLALMAQGRQGSSSQALGQAGSQAALVLQEQKRQQELGQYRQQMSALQQQQMQMAQAQQQAKADQQRQYQERLQDPAFLQSLSPMARQMAQLGVDPSELIRAQQADNLAQHRQAQLAQQQSQFDTRESRIGAGGGSSGPRMPTQRQVLDQPLGDGMMQRHVLNPQTGQYEAYGKPFPQYSPGRKSKTATGADAAVGAILNPTQPDGEPVPDVSSLPGTKPLADYMPQQQGPVGVLPMAAAGGNAMQKPAPKAGTRVPGQPQIARPVTKADYDALPAGSQYIDPVSGKTATKRG